MHELRHLWHVAVHTWHTSSFAWPFVLVALVAVPILLVAYALRERRRGARGSRFANPALMPNLVTRTPRWRRHAIPVILLLALAALVVGAARPQRTIIADKHQTTIVLALDTSRSMAATDVKPNRLAAAESAARTLVAALPVDGRVGVVAFTRKVHTLATPTDDRSVIDGALGHLQISGGTAIGDAIVTSLGLVQHDRTTQSGTTSNDRPTAAIVLLSDGSSTEGKVGPLVAARRAKKAGVAVYTVALGTKGGSIKDPLTGGQTPVAPDPAALEAVAKAGGGKGYSATNAAQLKEIYARIGKTIGKEPEQQDLGFGFIGLATLLVLGSSGLSLRWFRRAI
jgi:Ca-activated chloride channel family protein